MRSRLQKGLSALVLVFVGNALWEMAAKPLLAYALSILARLPGRASAIALDELYHRVGRGPADDIAIGFAAFFAFIAALLCFGLWLFSAWHTVGRIRKGEWPSFFRG